jgi:integrase
MVYDDAMALHLYRRHRRDCKAAHEEDSVSSEFDERRKGFRRCECPITASGTLDKRYRRQTTGRWIWDDAKAIAGQWEAAGSWVARVSVPEIVVPPVENRRLTIADAINAFLLHKETANAKKHTVAKYRTMTNQLLAFAADRGLIFIDQLTVTDIDAFYISWKDGIRTRAKKLDRLKSLVKFCLKRKWISENLTEDLKAPEGSSIPKQKTPFSDEQIERLYAACDKIKRTPRCDWDGEDLKDFINLSLYTGLRISDIVMFDIRERLNGNNILVRTIKNGADVYTWVPDWLVRKLKARELIHGPLIFRAGTALNVKQMTQIWRDRRLREVFQLAGPWKNFHPTPHLFRHTFARILLQKDGVTVRDVAELMGDTEEMILRHYGAWVVERQARLTKVLKDAFSDRPKLVAIK